MHDWVCCSLSLYQRPHLLIPWENKVIPRSSMRGNTSSEAPESSWHPPCHWSPSKCGYAFTLATPITQMKNTHHHLRCRIHLSGWCLVVGWRCPLNSYDSCILGWHWVNDTSSLHSFGFCHSKPPFLSLSIRHTRLQLKEYAQALYPAHLLPRDWGMRHDERALRLLSCHEVAQCKKCSSPPSEWLKEGFLVHWCAQPHAPAPLSCTKPCTTSLSWTGYHINLHPSVG